MDDRGIIYKSLAYTNKACRIIGGSTIHKFIKKQGQHLHQLNYDYIIIDEISMIPERFYKLFCIIKRIKPNIKFIIAGDFLQLLPVNDRIGCWDYKIIYCLYELVDGNRLQLTKCRRSDDKLFNMLLPENINNIKASDFNNKFTDRHITFTNKKRIEINHIMMKMECRKQNKQGLFLEKLHFDDNSQDVLLLENMPVIARKNYKELDIFNNETFIIKEILTDTIVIIDDENTRYNINIKDFQSLFYVAYAITIYKSQGSTFDFEYTIHEFNHPRFDNRLKYVSLSRSVDIKNINIII